MLTDRDAARFAGWWSSLRLETPGLAATVGLSHAGLGAVLAEVAADPRAVFAGGVAAGMVTVAAVAWRTRALTG